MTRELGFLKVDFAVGQSQRHLLKKNPGLAGQGKRISCCVCGEVCTSFFSVVALADAAELASIQEEKKRMEKTLSSFRSGELNCLASTQVFISTY